jgi:TcpE family
VDLPTYTNIWRIEKRLYKLYDFRLPAPLPITWIGVFVGITVPYVVFLIAVGLPFNHNLVWLYVLPPGVLTWLTTRPVIENKRLPELVSSQLRYIAEPRTWCRMAPFAEKDEILVSARVWHQHPPKARPKQAKKSLAQARSAERTQQLAADGPTQAKARPTRFRWGSGSPQAARPAGASALAGASVPEPAGPREAIMEPLAAPQTAAPPARPTVIGPAVPPAPEQPQVQVPVPEQPQVPVPVQVPVP